MKCYECKWLDRSVILTSSPPQYGCTLGFGSHYADHECEYDFMPIVRCKDCRHLDVWNLKNIYAVCSKHGITFEPFEDDTRTHFCSWGERREE